MNDPRNQQTSVTVNDAARALYQAMIGYAGPEATGWTGPLNLPEIAGEGQSVFILGAGVAGLTAAYELSKLGYACTVLEAQNRVGGRNHTARKGDKLFEIGPAGVPVETHTCAFDEKLYLNLGPGRIPYHHRRVLPRLPRGSGAVHHGDHSEPGPPLGWRVGPLAQSPGCQ
ncbi:MAG: FAD-dependent oxidoreductase [Pseudonocardiaceae bacterium]